jgi:hypothetical protein
MFTSFEFVRYAVPHNNLYILLLENISLYFVLQKVLELVTLFSSQQTTSPYSSIFHPSYALIFECDCIPLQCFYNVCINRTSNWLLVG